MPRFRFLLMLALAVVLLIAPAARSASADMVISQVFAGGGNANAPYTNDFVELFNRGSATVDLAGWSLQYATGTSTTPNMEMRCVAIDDGDFTIPRIYATEWQDAGVDASNTPHQAVLSRFNTVGANVADGVAVIVTRIDTTIVK